MRIQNESPPRAVLLALKCALVIGLLCLAGCGKKEDTTKDECKTGQLQISVKFSKDLGASGAPDRFGCPTRLSTQGASPPIDAWVGGTEAHWGPVLIVQLDKEATKPVREKEEDKCIYTWRQNCE
jgi:hypothetical protein